MKVLSFILLLFLSVPAYAQETPIEISADENLEWRQKEQQYIARGNVEAKQGPNIILAETIIADYKENTAGKTEIWRLTATGTVRLKNQDSTVTGEKAVYIVETGQADMTGGNLKLTTPNETVTAREKLSYNANTLIAKAVGNAEVQQADKTLSASTITANFTKTADGEQILKQATAQNNVTITTPSEVLKGDTGVYNAQSNKAEVSGNVKIIRGPNTLEGDRAEVNLTTNLSKMFGAPEKGKRVKATFFPGSEGTE